MATTDFRTIDEYIASFPEEDQKVLQKIRMTIQNAAPGAEEVISYQMPTFRFKGILVHFAAFKNHIGFFPTPSAIVAFKKELLQFETSKGTIKFYKDKPIPYNLIAEITKFRVKENLEKSKNK
jgi:uncharacterized protein YdhG (YjbR/CyaY superfamily)